MDPRTILEAPSDIAFRKLEEASWDLTQLPLPMQTLVLVHAAQGVIDNGGFQYFFENSWPNTPSYTLFSEAYRRINAYQAAEALDMAVSMFPFDTPHLDDVLRNEFMDSLPETHPFFQLGDSICGNESVWVQLSDYVSQNLHVFECA